MPVNVDFLPEDRLIIIQYSGTATWEDFQAATEKADQYIKSRDCRSVLVDMRDTEPAVSLGRIFDMAKVYDSIGVPRNVKIAMVGPKTAPGYDDFQFYETVCRNRGFEVEVFDEMNSAKEWLLGIR